MGARIVAESERGSLMLPVCFRGWPAENLPDHLYSRMKEDDNERDYFSRRIRHKIISTYESDIQTVASDI